MEPNAVTCDVVTDAHLISYNPDTDLLPLVLAHCNYSLKVGEGTSIQYDFEGFSKRVQELFILGKPNILFQMTTMPFREDVTDSKLFERLQEKVLQEPLSHVIKNQIAKEKLTLPDLYDCLAVLKITIEFLLSVGGDGDTMIHKFMTETLKMKTGLSSIQARQNCRLKHIEHLWIILQFECSKMLQNNRQEPFENEVCLEPLKPEQIEGLRQAFKIIKVDKFMENLHRCIILKIAIKQDESAEDYKDVTEYSLKLTLVLYFDENEHYFINEDTEMLQGIPEDITGRQAIAVWQEAFKFLESAST